MRTWRIGVIGLGQRIAHVLGAMVEVGWRLELAGHVDPAPPRWQSMTTPSCRR